MAQNNNTGGGGLSLGSLLIAGTFLVFLTLKLTGHIDWSWWWVTAPLWGPAAAVILFVAVVALGYFCILRPVLWAGGKFFQWHGRRREAQGLLRHLDPTSGERGAYDPVATAEERQAAILRRIAEVRQRQRRR